MFVMTWVLNHCVSEGILSDMFELHPPIIRTAVWILSKQAFSRCSYRDTHAFKIVVGLVDTAFATLLQFRHRANVSSSYLRGRSARLSYIFFYFFFFFFFFFGAFSPSACSI